MYSPASPGGEIPARAADHRAHLELEVEALAARRHRDVLAGTRQRVRVREVAERRLVPDRRNRRVRVRVLDHARDVLLEHREVADRRRLHRGEQCGLVECHLSPHAAGDPLPLDGVHAQHIEHPNAVIQNPDRVTLDHGRASAAVIVNSSDPHDESFQMGADAVMMTALRVASGSIGSEWSCSHWPTFSEPSTIARQRS